MRYIKYYLKSLAFILLAALFPSSAFAAKDFNIKNNSQNYFHVDGATGNIGVGTTTPQGALVVTKGNVGIGTWAPTNPLSIVSSAGNIQFIPDTIGAGSKMQINATGSGAFEFGSYVGASFNDLTNNTSFAAALSTNNLAFTLASSSAYIDFTTNNWLSKMRILGDGNVGIGTKTPQARLAVMGGNVGIGTLTAATASLETTGLRLIGNGAAAGNVLVSSSTGIGTWMAAGTLPASTGPWSSGTGTVYTTSGSDNVGIGTSTPQGGLVVTNGNVGIGTWTANNSLIIAKGNIGIGTLSPSQTLDVVGNISATGGLGVGLVVPYAKAEIQPSGNALTSAAETLRIRTGGSSGTATGITFAVDLTTASAGLVGAKILHIRTGGNSIGDLAFSTNATGVGSGDGSAERMRITALGNVGIGTITPGSTLSVNGGMGIGTAIPYFNTAAPANGMIVQGNVGIGTFENVNGRLIVHGGNVGVGTMMPQTALSVLGNVGLGTWTADNARLETDGFRLMNNGATAGSVLVSSSTGIGTWMAASTLATSSSTPGGNNKAVQYNNSGAFGGDETVFSFDGNNVGVGTVTPLNKLVVSGGVGIGTGKNSSYVNAIVPTGGLIVQGNVGIGTLASSSQLAVGFRPTSQLAVDNGGNTTINVTTSSVSALVVSADSMGDGTVLTAQSASNSLANTVLKVSYTGSSSVPAVLVSSSGGQGLAVTNANVGIGTTKGFSSLSVAGNIGVGTIKYSPFVTSSAPSGGMILEGNVGIGTTTPQARLSIIGGNVGIGTWTADNASLETTGLRLIGNGAAAGSVLVSSSTGIGTWMAASTLATSGGGTPGGSSSQLQYNNGGSFDGISNSNVTASGNVGLGTTLTMNKLDVSGGVGIGTSYAGYKSAQSNGLIVEGNVGIGSYNPTQLLSIYGGSPSGGGYTANPLVSIYNTNAGSGEITMSLDMPSNAGTWMTFKRGGTVLGAFGSGNAVFNVNSGNNDMVFTRNTTESLRIATGGNIGLGTTAPQGKLIVWDGNVGIGTISPIAPLDTSGFRLMNNGAAAGNVLVSSSTGIGTWMAASTLATSGAASGWSTGTGTVYNTTGSDNIGIGTITPQGGLVVTNGNVGIGTWAPDSALSVRLGNVGIGTGATHSKLEVVGDGAQELLRINDSGPNDSSPILVTSGGNVGVGTSAVPYTLSLFKNTTTLNAVGGEPVAAAFWTTSTGTSPSARTVEIQNDAANGTAIAVITSRSTVGDSQGISFVFGGAMGQNYSPLTTVRTSYTAANSTNLVFSTASGGSLTDKVVFDANGNVGVGTVVPKNKMAIVGNVGVGTGINSPYLTTAAPSGGMIVQGNVGIGSYAPGTTLDVNGTQRIIASGGDGTGLNIVNPSSMISIQMAATGSNTWFMGASTSSNSVGAGKLFFSRSSTTSASDAVFDGSGNFGVGTITPQARLSVTGGNVGIGTWTADSASLETTGLRLIGNGAAAGSVLVSGSTGIGTWMAASTLATSGGGTPGGSSSQLQYNNDGSLAGISSGATNGTNIGIGTVALQNRLNVSGNVGVSTLTISPYLNQSRGSTAAMAIEGNVGIGTWNPGYSFQVKENRLLPTVAMFQGACDGCDRGVQIWNSGTGASTSSSISFLTTAGYYASIGGKNSAGGQTVDLTFTPSGTGGVNFEAMRLNYDGNLGIGTSTPQAKLAVLGGNVGIGTWTATAGLDTDTFCLRTAPSSGYVMVSGSTGIGTWMAASTLATSGAASGWSTGTGTVYNTTGSDKVGIGTTTPQGGFVVTNGNVGIGTWAPQALLDVAGTGDAYFTSNLGIGSVNPTQALDVVGTGKFSTGVNAPKLTNLTSNGFVKTGSGDGTLSVDTNTYPSYSSMTTNYLQKATSSSAVGNSSIFDNGNVGIGTTTPQGGLVVTNGNVGVGTWTASNTLSVRGSAAIGSSGAYTATNSIAAGNLAIEGNLGIGTFNPRYNLEFNSSTIFIHNAATSYLYLSGGINLFSSSSPISGQLSVNAPVSIGAIVSAPSAGLAVSGNVGVGTSAANNNSLTVVGNMGIGTGKSSSYVYASAPVGGIIIEGNVGIGTTTPQARLSVIGGNVGIGTWTADSASLETTGLRLIGNNAAAGSVLVSSSTGIGTWMAASTLATSGGGTPGGSSSQLQYNNGGSFDGIVNSNVTASGNVGLGTTLSKNKLDVQGGVGVGTLYAGYYTTTGNGMIIQGNVGVGSYAPEFSMVVVGDTTNAALGPLYVKANGLSTTVGAGVSLNAAASSGKTYSFISTGSSAAPGAGAFAVFNSTDSRYDWVQLSTGHLNFARNFYTDIAQVALIPTASNVVGLISRGAAAQTADLIQAQDSSGNVLVNVTAAGNVGIGTTTPQDKFILYGGNVGIGTWTAQSSLQLKGSMGVAVISKTANYTATVNDYVILVDASGGAVTITLPAASTVSGRLYNIKKTDSSANAVIIDGNAAETVDGSATVSTTTQYQAFTVVCDGTQWWVI